MPASNIRRGRFGTIQDKLEHKKLFRKSSAESSSRPSCASRKEDCCHRNGSHCDTLVPAHV